MVSRSRNTPASDPGLDAQGMSVALSSQARDQDHWPSEGQAGAVGFWEWRFRVPKLTLVIVLCYRAGGFTRWTTEGAGSSEAKPHFAEAVQASPGGHPRRETGKHGDKESKFWCPCCNSRYLSFRHRVFLD